jgi:hypothetical protein
MLGGVGQETLACNRTLRLQSRKIPAIVNSPQMRGSQADEVMVIFSGRALSSDEAGRGGL